MKALALDSKPADINILSQPYWDAFWTLHRSRTFDFNGNPNAVALSEKKAYLDLFPEDDITIFIRMVSSMDNTYLTFTYKKQEEGRKSSKTKNKGVKADGVRHNDKRRTGLNKP